MNPIFMDPYDGEVLGKSFDEQFDLIRISLGQIQHYAQQTNLAAMLPERNLVSSAHCLANEGKNYIVYLSDTNQVTVDLTGINGASGVEWFNPSTGETINGPEWQEGSSQNFESPFKEEGVVLFIQSPPSP